MKQSEIPQSIVVPTYYYIDEDGLVHFDLEEMEGFFANQMDELESLVLNKSIK